MQPTKPRQQRPAPNHCLEMNSYHSFPVSMLWTTKSGPSVTGASSSSSEGSPSSKRLTIKQRAPGFFPKVTVTHERIATQGFADFNHPY
jgi:hypothetical protein